MVKLYFEFELADNGVIVRGIDDNTLTVYQEKKSDKGSVNGYMNQALYSEVTACLRDIMLQGTPDMPAKDKYKLKIEIR